MERARVLRAQGPGARFTYTDYAIKILLSPVLRKYFMMDQSRMMMGGGGLFGGLGGPMGMGGGGATYQTTYVSSNQGCCVTM
jgi:hypothetical protein